MNKPRDLSPNNTRELRFETCVTEGLGYCCEYFFWQKYAGVETELIAARMGVSERTARRRRLKAQRGELKCRKEEACLIQPKRGMLK